MRGTPLFFNSEAEIDTDPFTRLHNHETIKHHVSNIISMFQQTDACPCNTIKPSSASSLSSLTSQASGLINLKMSLKRISDIKSDDAKIKEDDALKKFRLTLVNVELT